MLAGKQLGKYHLVRSIGSGGMGEIYLAEDSRIPRQVALKVMHAEAEIYAGSDEANDAQKLFRREMRAVTMLNHPYILQLFDFGEERVEGHTFLYLVMPWQPEGSLADWLQRRDSEGGLSLCEAAHFVCEAADALQHVHEHSLIHQDVKPTNFLVRGRSEALLPDVLLADFGISKITATSSLVSQNIRGTPAYMAPEQWQGRPVPATDQYALAVMAYVLLTGHFPFTGRMEQLLHQHFFVEPPPPSSYNQAIPPEVDATILTALAKEPENRFHSMLDFAQVFQAEEYHAGADAHPLFFSGCALPARPTGFTTEMASSLIGGSPVNEPEPTFSTQASPSLLNNPRMDTQETEGPPVSASLSKHNSENVSALLSDTDNIFGKSGVSRIDLPAHKGTPVGFMRGKIGKMLLAVFLLLFALAGFIGMNKYQQDQQARTLANEQATANAALVTSPAYMPDHGSEVFQDPLQEPKYWNPNTNAGIGGSCQYTNNALHVLETQRNRFYLCSNELTLPNNTEFEVKMRIVKGNCGDIYFRYDSNTEHGYLFKICAENNKGFYAIRKYQQLKDSNPTSLAAAGSSSVIQSSPGASNTIGIDANGGTMSLYINGKKMASGIDTDYVGGSIGLCADAAGKQSEVTEVAFNDARVWEIKN